MSEPIVLELQRLATDRSQDVDDLLRKAFIVATKLSISDFRTWIDRELRGYDRGKDVPKYRFVRAQLQAFNDVQGRLIPYYLPEDIADLICNVPILQPIGALAELARSTSGTFQLTLSPIEAKVLLEAQGAFPMQPVKTIPRTEVTRIVDAVRTTILEWALQLEQEGILGQGMAFTGEEKHKAATSANIHIGNFQGILGDVTQSEIIQNLQMAVVPGDFGSLRRFLQAKGIDDADLDELRQSIEADPTPTTSGRFGDRVSAWIGKMTSKAATGAWRIAIATAGNLLASAISAYYGIR